MPSQRFLARMQVLLCLPGKIAAWLILPLIASTVITVIAAMMSGSTLIDWEGSVPLFGSALTVNSLMDMQWYIFALIVMFGGIWSYTEERHVTVDVIAMRLSARVRAWIAILGDLFLLMPFCAVSIWYGWKFAAIAWRTGEGSTVGGLSAHWLIKGAVPAAFALLALSGIVRIARTAIDLRSGRFNEADSRHGS